MEIFKTFKNPKDLLITAGLIIFAGLVFLMIWQYQYAKLPQEVLIITEKPVYSSGESLRLAIKNVLPATICLSSCFPYYLETKGETWHTYEYYENCSHPDIVENCIKPDYARFYEIELPDLNPGLHRILVPTMESGKVGDMFESEKEYLSNEFIIE